MFNEWSSTMLFNHAVSNQVMLNQVMFNHVMFNHVVQRVKFNHVVQPCGLTIVNKIRSEDVKTVEFCSYYHHCISIEDTNTKKKNWTHWETALCMVCLRHTVYDTNNRNPNPKPIGFSQSTIGCQAMLVAPVSPSQCVSTMILIVSNNWSTLLRKTTQNNTLTHVCSRSWSFIGGPLL